MKAKKYTMMELDYLRMEFPKRPTKEIAEHLGRSVNAISVQANKMEAMKKSLMNFKALDYIDFKGLMNSTISSTNNMANIKACLMTGNNEWSTPADLFSKLNEEFHFNLDPCSTDANAKCKRHFTKEQDGLSRDWGGARVFCNPPYGKEIKRWVLKCYEESRKADTLVVMLIPARTDTSYFHDYIYHKAREIRFLRGRLHFNDVQQGAPFPSMIVVF